MSSATEAVTRATFAGIAKANDAPRSTSQPVRSASAQRMLMPTGMGSTMRSGFAANRYRIVGFADAHHDER